jgi:hypothetical protein
VIDATLARRIFVARRVRRGEGVVLDRFVFDIAIDIAVSARDDKLLRGRAARALYRCANGMTVLVLDAPLDVLERRRPDLRADDLLAQRARLYQDLAVTHGLEIVDTTLPIEATMQWILRCAERHLDPAGSRHTHAR